MRSVQRVKDGPIVTGTKDMLEQTRQFYVDLYTDEGIEDEAQETILINVTSGSLGFRHIGPKNCLKIIR